MIPPLAVATEAWPPNVPAGTPRRHPVKAWWSEIYLVLAPGGTYLSQQVGPASVFELVAFCRGAQPVRVRRSRHRDDAVTAAAEDGLDIVRLQTASLRTDFYDLGAVIYFLRKVIWMVPGLTVEAHEAKLRELHAIIERDGKFFATTTRFLIEARKP